jgi:hypothetical protein
MSETQKATPTIELPPFYKSAGTSIKKSAQRRDPEYKHGWFKVGPSNEVVKTSKGWVPCEDKETLVKIGLGALIQANGRARIDELELWRMPIALARAIRQHLAEKTAEKSTSVKASLDALAADTIGRSGGKVVPVVQAGYGQQGDVLTRTPFPMPKTGPMVSVPGKKE